MFEDIPNNIVYATVFIILMVIGIFVVGQISITSESVAPVRQIEYFDVANPTVDQTVILQFIPSQEPVVAQFNGIAWVPVGSQFITWSATTPNVIVASGGLQG